MWLFSYGSNSPRQLGERLGRPAVCRPAYALGYWRVFRGFSERWQGGVATLVPKADGVTYGSVCEVTRRDLAALDVREGVGRGSYERTAIEVMVDGAEVSAQVYLALSTTFHAPSRAYLEAVAETIGAFWSGDGGPVRVRDIPIR